VTLLIVIIWILLRTEDIEFDMSAKMFKPPYDKREFRHLTLSNELEVIVVSDPQATIAGAAMSVGVGSYSEPKRIPGIAHLLEHMLFLGSRKYPDRTEFLKLTSSSGGDFNAYTSGTETNFHFTAGANVFEEALEIFSWFF
jgi:secreted Zn-dependent insulinase-like peptidase